MNYALLTICLLLAFNQSLLAQNQTVAGYVKDQLTGEPLIGCTVRAEQAKAATVTNTAGYFSIRLLLATVINVSYLGYASRRFLVDSLPSRPVTIALVPQPSEIQGVSVVATQIPAENNLPGVVSIPVAQLKQIPMALGETDIVKALALTPGVTVGNEATAGLLVRGGSPDQNLIRLDEATLYNQTHLFGFASAFNSDAIKHVTLYKGVFPARFGGRLSSVLDITTREGNQYKTAREINVGLLSSRFLVDGPVNRRWRRPATYMVSARSSYITLFLLPTIISYNRGNAEGYFNYWLYDINAKMTVALDSSKRLSVSLFRGRDDWYGWDGNRQERSKFGLNWGNTTGTLRYTQAIRKSLFWSALLAYSQYQYQTGYSNYTVEDQNQTLSSRYGIQSSVRDWSVRMGLEWFVSPQYEFRAGAETILHRYQPSSVRTTFDLNKADGSNPPINAVEQAFYTENDWKPTSSMALSLGVRTVFFAVLGKTYPSVEP